MTTEWDRVLDKLYEAGLTDVFVTVALCAARKFGVKMNSLHHESEFVPRRWRLHKQRNSNRNRARSHRNYLWAIEDHRPDLKQFILDLMCSGDGDIPLYLRVADGNESDSAMFATIIADFKQQWQIDTLFVADAALYTLRKLATNETVEMGIESTRYPDCCKNTVREYATRSIE